VKGLSSSVDGRVTLSGFLCLLTLFDDFTNPVPENRYKEYQKKDQEFHGEILMLSGNRVILDFIRNFEFILRCYQKGLIRNPNETLLERKDVINAIRNKNPEEAQKLIMTQHWKTPERLKIYLTLRYDLSFLL
jgi:DNA-binding GntR family transcriptional regulator